MSVGISTICYYFGNIGTARAAVKWFPRYTPVVTVIESPLLMTLYRNDGFFIYNSFVHFEIIIIQWQSSGVVISNYLSSTKYKGLPAVYIMYMNTWHPCLSRHIENDDNSAILRYLCYVWQHTGLMYYILRENGQPMPTFRHCICFFQLCAVVTVASWALTAQWTSPCLRYFTRTIIWLVMAPVPLWPLSDSNSLILAPSSANSRA